MKNREEVRSKTWRLRGACVTPTLLLGGWIPRVFAGAGRYWNHWSCGVRAWAASPGRVIPSMAGGPVLWQLLPFEVLRSY